MADVVIFAGVLGGIICVAFAIPLGIIIMDKYGSLILAPIILFCIGCFIYKMIVGW